MDKVKIIRRNRKTLALIVREDESVEVRAPIFMSKKRINEFLDKSSEWIIKRRNQIRKLSETKKLFPDANDSKAVRQYKKLTMERLTPRLDYYSKLTGMTYSSIKISSARRRWGSCNSKNALCFTWRLAKVPDYALDYIVLHELLHTVQKDHSRKFWQRMSKIMPDYKKRKAILKNYGLEALS